MGKYLLLWEVDPTRTPEDAMERGAAWELLIAMVKEDIKKGMVKEWGAFVGEINGYLVAEGSEVEIGNMVQQYVPFVTFKVRAAASVSQIDEMVKVMQQ